MAKNHFSRAEKDALMGILGVVCIDKRGFGILIRALEVPFLGPQNAKNGSNKNSSEILGAKELGLDRAPIEF